MQAKVIEVLWTQSRIGLGADENDPVRIITELWTKDGRLLASSDFATGEVILDLQALGENP